jgi:hypothetical protein
VKLLKCLFGALILWAGSTAALAADVGLTIRYYDKRIYYMQEDPIQVQITITNATPSTYRFKLADERVFSVDFDIRTMSNRAVEQADVLKRRRFTSQQVFFREIAIEPGESFSFIEDLRNYANLRQSGSYVVQARIYTELFRTAGLSEGVPPLESNRLNLNIRPPSILNAEGIPVALDVETNAILVREKLAPDQVVTYILTARQKSQWEKFFLYLDLEAMISRDGARNNRWLAESEEGRRYMLARYRADLEAEVIDGDIAAIPMEFTIERTSYSSEEGTVTVLEKFKTGDYIEKKRYTYYLRRRDEIWTIIDYTVSNLGTE